MSVYIPAYSLDAVSEITLLTPDEWEDIVSRIPNIPVNQKTDWWVLDPNGKHICVTRSGLLKTVSYKNGTRGIRPVFIFDKAGLFENGTKITVEENLCTVIDKHKALSDELLEIRSYNDIIEYLNSPFFKDLLKDGLPF